MAVTLLLRLWSLLTNLTALLCTISSWFESVSVCGDQTVKAYSRVGRTKVCTLCLLGSWFDVASQEGNVEFAF